MVKIIIEPLNSSRKFLNQHAWRWYLIKICISLDCLRINHPHSFIMESVKPWAILGNWHYFFQDFSPSQNTAPHTISRGPLHPHKTEVCQLFLHSLYDNQRHPLYMFPKTKWPKGRYSRWLPKCLPKQWIVYQKWSWLRMVPPWPSQFCGVLWKWFLLWLENYIR